jgi:histidine triad (HIT) family protein
MFDIYNKNNIFAKILRKELPSEPVYEDDEVMAINDINPVAPVHILVIPKVEAISFHDFTTNNSSDLVAGFFRKVRQVAELSNLHDSGYRIVFNHGSDAGQTVPHFHVHIIGGKQLGEL